MKLSSIVLILFSLVVSAQAKTILTNDEEGLVSGLRRHAITEGELDGETHPHVVLLSAEVDGSPAFRCSGVMLDPKTVLTAGHCVTNTPTNPVTGISLYPTSDMQECIDNGMT